MDSKTIKISKENYLWLLRKAAELQKKHHKPISFDYVINNLKNSKFNSKKSIENFAGVWKDLTNEAADKLKENIKKIRKESTGYLTKNDIYRF